MATANRNRAAKSECLSGFFAQQYMTQAQFKERYYLHLIQLANLAINEISQVLLTIANKRLTLAEKAIMSELCTCTYWQGHFIAALAQQLQEKKYVLSSSDGKIFRQVSKDLIDKLQGFHKAASHSLNYLEQYFEHDLWLALNQNQISLHLSNIVANLKNKDESRALTKC